MNANHIYFVNSYSEAGIGDFGKDVIKEFLYRKIKDFKVLETNSTWRSLINIWSELLKHRNQVIMNIGFTSFGKSSVRNFFNFLLIGLSTIILKKKITIVLHDFPELADPSVSGYKMSFFLRLGGDIATSMIYKCRVLVFSHRLFEILKKNFKIKGVYFVPFPSTNEPVLGKFDKNKTNVILTIGYLAPYKGLESLGEIKKQLPNYEVFIIGKDHKILSSLNGGIEYFKNLRSYLSNAGVKLLGYLSEDNLKELVRSYNCVGILPYKYTSGSSFSAIFMMGLGIPIITSNLEEFLILKELGGGLICVDNTHQNYPEIIHYLFTDYDKYNSLTERSFNYCTKYSISNFVNFLLDGVL